MITFHNFTPNPVMIGDHKIDPDASLILPVADYVLDSKIAIRKLSRCKAYPVFIIGDVTTTITTWGALSVFTGGRLIIPSIARPCLIVSPELTWTNEDGTWQLVEPDYCSWLVLIGLIAVIILVIFIIASQIKKFMIT